MGLDSIDELGKDNLQRGLENEENLDDETHCLSTASGQRYSEALITLLQASQDGLDAFFLVLPKLDLLRSLGWWYSYMERCARRYISTRKWQGSRASSPPFEDRQPSSGRWWHCLRACDNISASFDITTSIRCRDKPQTRLYTLLFIKRRSLESLGSEVSTFTYYIIQGCLSTYEEEETIGAEPSVDVIQHSDMPSRKTSISGVVT